MSAIRVLLVEDEKDIQFIVELALERSGHFAITTFDTGDEALEYLSASQAEFDLAVVNFKLPGMDGLDFIKAARAIPSFANLPAIVISAALLDREMAAYSDAGVLGVISKPFDVETLPNRVLALYRRDGGER